MVTAEGIVKLVDFGLAKSFSGGFPAGEVPHTVQGSFAGTAAYVSPEMAEGRSVDLRSDIFSFGSVLYEMLTGRPAFSREFRRLRARRYPTRTRPAQPHPPGPGSPPGPDSGTLSSQEPGRTVSAHGRGPPSAEKIRDSSNPRLRRRVARSMIQVVGAAACLGALIFGGSLALRMANRRPEPVTLFKVTADTGLTAFPPPFPPTASSSPTPRTGAAWHLDLWVQQVGGNDPIRLTSDPADDYQPAFSPDGTRIAYRSERNGGGVYITPALSPAERLLVPGCPIPSSRPMAPGSPVGPAMSGAPSFRAALISRSSRARAASPASFAPTSRWPPILFGVRIPAACCSWDGRPRLRHPQTSIGGLPRWRVPENVAAGAVSRIKSAGRLPLPACSLSGRRHGSGAAMPSSFTATHGDATNIWELPLGSIRKKCRTAGARHAWRILRCLAGSR